MESDDNDIERCLQLSATVMACLIYRRTRKQRIRKMWIRKIFARRRKQGEYHNLLQEMRLSDQESHFKYIRMTKESFDFLGLKVNGLFFCI